MEHKFELWTLGEKLSDRVIAESTQPGLALYNAYVCTSIPVFEDRALTGLYPLQRPALRAHSLGESGARIGPPIPTASMLVLHPSEPRVVPMDFALASSRSAATRSPKGTRFVFYFSLQRNCSDPSKELPEQPGADRTRVRGRTKHRACVSHGRLGVCGCRTGWGVERDQVFGPHGCRPSEAQWAACRARRSMSTSLPVMCANKLTLLPESRSTLSCLPRLVSRHSCLWSLMAAYPRS